MWLSLLKTGQRRRVACCHRGTLKKYNKKCSTRKRVKMIDSRSALVEIHGTAITSPLNVQHNKIYQKMRFSPAHFIHAAIHTTCIRAVELWFTLCVCVCVCNSFSLGGGVVPLVQMTKLSPQASRRNLNI